LAIHSSSYIKGFVNYLINELIVTQIINDHRRNSQEHFKINITELNPVVEMLVGIFNKCFDGKEIYIEGLMIKDAIMYCF